MKTAFRDLIEFERACGHKLTAGGPAVPDAKTKALRIRLITEECSRTDRGYRGGRPCGDRGRSRRPRVRRDWERPFATESILPVVWDAIQKANLAKTGPGSHRNPATGKLEKPKDWRHPDIAAILNDQDSLASIYF